MSREIEYPKRIEGKELRRHRPGCRRRARWPGAENNGIQAGCRFDTRPRNHLIRNDLRDSLRRSQTRMVALEPPNREKKRRDAIRIAPARRLHCRCVGRNKRSAVPAFGAQRPHEATCRNCAALVPAYFLSCTRSQALSLWYGRLTQGTNKPAYRQENRPMLRKRSGPIVKPVILRIHPPWVPMVLPSFSSLPCPGRFANSKARCYHGRVPRATCRRVKRNDSTLRNRNQ